MGAAYAFAILYGFFGGGYIGLMPVILAHIFDRNKLYAHFSLRDSSLLLELTIDRTCPACRASLTGIFFTSELPGQLAGAPIAGAILTATGNNWVYAILFSGLIQIFGTLFAVAARLVVEKRIFVTI